MSNNPTSSPSLNHSYQSRPTKSSVREKIKTSMLPESGKKRLIKILDSRAMDAVGLRQMSIMLNDHAQGFEDSTSE